MKEKRGISLKKILYPLLLSFSLFNQQKKYSCIGKYSC
jgi:hypothetical protein